MVQGELKVEADTGRLLRAGVPVVPRDRIAGRTRGLETGAVVDVADGRGFIGRGLFEAEGPTGVLLYGRDRKVPLDGAFWKARIGRALELRQGLVNLTWTDAFRVVNGSGDFLPGLVLETYSAYGVLRLGTESLRPHLGPIVDAVRATLSPRGLYEKRRTAEGARGHHLGGSTAPDALPVREGKLRFLARMAEGHQTGFFLDMREARRALSRYCRGRHVLNCHAFSGALSLTAAASGSPRVLSLDASPRSASWARENFAANGLPPESHEFLTGEPAEVLGRIATSARRFDLVVVETPDFPEPPPAVKAKAAKKAKKAPKRKAAAKRKPAKGKAAGRKRRMAPPAAPDPRERFRRGYGSLVRAAIGVLQPQGLLACTLLPRDLAWPDFLQLLQDAAAAAGATLQVLEVHGLPADFPANPAWPHGHDLRFAICAVRK